MSAFARSFCLLALLLFLARPAAAQDPPDGHTIEGDLMHPESVAHDPDADVFYAANIGEKLAPSAKDGDGFIARLSPDGAVETLRFLPASDDATLHAPKGTVVLDGQLYTADIDRVVGFNLETREKSAEISLADKGVSFLNDIAAMDGQTLFASASNQGKIYRVDLAAGTATALDVDVPGANGVTYAASEGVLYAVTFGGEQGGTLWTLELSADGTVGASSSRTLVEKGRFDGVVLRPNEQILISDWGVEGASTPTPALHRVGEGGTGSVTTIELPGWQGPADFSCAPTRGCWIPDLPGGFVEVVRPDEREE
jgi:DNA-binding beta-propeller fold protein YncE